MSKLGTKERPAIVRVQNEERAMQIYQLCQSRGWQVIVGIEPDKSEDITDVQRLISPPAPIHSENIKRNEPCPCGSGRKAKKCCYA